MYEQKIINDQLAYSKYRAANLTLVEVRYIHGEASKQKNVLNFQTRLFALLLETIFYNTKCNID